MPFSAASVAAGLKIASAAARKKKAKKDLEDRLRRQRGIKEGEVKKPRKPGIGRGPKKPEGRDPERPTPYPGTGRGPRRPSGPRTPTPIGRGPRRPIEDGDKRRRRSGTPSKPGRVRKPKSLRSLKGARIRRRSY